MNSFVKMDANSKGKWFFSMGKSLSMFETP